MKSADLGPGGRRCRRRGWAVEDEAGGRWGSPVHHGFGQNVEAEGLVTMLKLRESQRVRSVTQTELRGRS